MKAISRAKLLLHVIASASLTSACASAQTHVQLWQDGKEPWIPTHNYFADVTVVPDGIAYVQITQWGYVVEKQFPSVFFSNRWIEVNSLLRESDVVMSPRDLRSVFKLEQGLKCGTDLRKQKIPHIEIRGRAFDGSGITCDAMPKVACEYLNDVASAEYVHDTSYNFSEPKVLFSRIGCDALLNVHPATRDGKD